MLDLATTAPLKAWRWHERHRWIEEHPGWTFAEYDAASGSDILLHHEYLKMRMAAEKKAREKQEKDALATPTRTPTRG